RILEALASSDGDCSITGLANDLGIAKARIYRHLHALHDHGYVKQNPKTSKYGIGWRLFLLGQNLLKGSSLATIARPFAEELRNRVQLTTVISTFKDKEIAVLDFIAGGRTLDVGLMLGARFQLHVVAQGKVALAFGPANLLESTLEGDLSSSTPHTITDREQ